MSLCLLGLTDTVQRLKKLRTYLQACLKRNEQKKLQCVPFLINTTLWKTVLTDDAPYESALPYMGCCPQSSLAFTLFGAHSSYFSQGNWTPDATWSDGAGAAELAWLLIRQYAKNYKGKNIRAEVTKRLLQPNIAEINFPLPQINVYIVLQSKAWKFFF